MEIQNDETIKLKKTNSKEYNKQYYQNHKEHIINDLICLVVECNICHHKVTKGRLNGHQKTKLCLRRKKIEQV